MDEGGREGGGGEGRAGEVELHTAPLGSTWSALWSVEVDDWQWEVAKTDARAATRGERREWGVATAAAACATS